MAFVKLLYKGRVIGRVLTNRVAALTVDNAVYCGCGYDTAVEQDCKEAYEAGFPAAYKKGENYGINTAGIQLVW